MVLEVILVLLAVAVASFLAGAVFASVNCSRAKELDRAEAMRRIRLACGDGWKHPHACRELASLRAEGYEVVQSGSQRTGIVQVNIWAPGDQKLGRR